MKKLYFLITLLVANYCSKAQWYNQDCTNQQSVYVDSFNFDTPGKGNIILFLDSTFTNNIWQVGSVQKAGFPIAFSGTKALQTDTMNAYPVNNQSAVIFYTDSTYIKNPGTFSVIFWHYYDTDTLKDICRLQISADSGNYWDNSRSYYTSPMLLQIVYYIGSLNNYQGEVLFPDSLQWSGKSGGWRRESLCLAYPAMKGYNIPTRYGVRFLFESDSIQTNKPGWIIDNIQFKEPHLINGLEDVNETKLVIAPNPTGNGIFTIDYPKTYVTGNMDIYSTSGQLVRRMVLSPSVNISDLPKGLYYYRVIFNNTGQQFKGTLVYN